MHAEASPRSRFYWVGRWLQDYRDHRTSLSLTCTLYYLQAVGHLGAAAAKSLQLCPTLCDPIDGSPPGSPVPGILQAGTLEWIAISFSNAWKWKVEEKSLSHVRLLVPPWTVAHQAPPPMGFSRQEHWSGVPLPSPLGAAVKSLQSCPNLCDPIDGSPPGSPVPGILQAGTLEWVPSPSPMP